MAPARSPRHTTEHKKYLIVCKGNTVLWKPADEHGEKRCNAVLFGNILHVDNAIDDVRADYFSGLHFYYVVSCSIFRSYYCVVYYK